MENISSQILESDIIEIPLIKNDPFYQANVVYYCKYKKRPNFYFIRYTYQNHNNFRTLLDRLEEHESETKLKPIVVFAYKQISNFTCIHPEQFEIDLQNVC